MATRFREGEDFSGELATDDSEDEVFVWRSVLVVDDAILDLLRVSRDPACGAAEGAGVLLRDSDLKLLVELRKVMSIGPDGILVGDTRRDIIFLLHTCQLNDKN